MDLYKINDNKLLDRLVASQLGTRIGDICFVMLTCADDLALSTVFPLMLQRLVNIEVDISYLEKFFLQPNKKLFSVNCVKKHYG